MVQVRTASPPAAVSDLSSEGLIYLLEISGAVVTKTDLLRARWHELVRASERAHNVWRAEADKESALPKPPAGRWGSSAYHKAQATHAAARERTERAWRAASRAHEAAQAFYKAHLAPQPREVEH